MLLFKIKMCSMLISSFELKINSHYSTVQEYVFLTSYGIQIVGCLVLLSLYSYQRNKMLWSLLGKILFPLLHGRTCIMLSSSLFFVLPGKYIWSYMISKSLMIYPYYFSFFISQYWLCCMFLFMAVKHF